MGIRFVTRPDDIPALPYPLDHYGYVLVPGRRYSKLAHTDLSQRPGEGVSVVAFVEWTEEEGLVVYQADSWKKCGRRMSAKRAAPLVPCIEAARAYADGTGPATWQECQRVEVDEQGREVATVDLDELAARRAARS